MVHHNGHILVFVCNDGANLRKKSELRKPLSNYLIQVSHGLNLFFFSTETQRHREQGQIAISEFAKSGARS
jgi:hypothetical protein